MGRIRMNRVFWPIIALLSAVVLLMAYRYYAPAVVGNKIGRIIRPPHEVSALAIQNGTIWAGGQEGVFLIDASTGRVKSGFKNGSGFEYVKDLMVDKEGLIWIAHPKGLSCYDGHGLFTFTVKDGLPDNRVNCIQEDRQGRIWVGTWGGAAYLDDKQWKVINKQKGLLADMVNVILEDQRGGLWFGSYAVRGGGVSYYDGKQWTYLTTQNKMIPDPNITDMLEDMNGNILIASGFVDSGGLVRIKMDGGNIDNFTIQSRKDGLAGAKVRSLFQEPSGTLWVASEYDGVARITESETKVFTTDNGLSGNETKDWLLDEAGSLWMATDNGITLIGKEELAQLSKVKEAGF